jgi:hypothetical protein
LPCEGEPAVSTTATSDRFTTLPDEKTLAETVVALEKHVDDADRGRHDRARPAEQGRELAASLPAAEFRLVQEAGHTPVYETPEVVAAAVRDVLARI